MAQILGYLTSEEGQQFQTYARQLGIRDSALANLLVIRELRASRLGELVGRFDSSAPAGSPKITAHLADPQTKPIFAKHTATFNLKPTPAATILFRAELSERWLESAINSVV